MLSSPLGQCVKDAFQALASTSKEQLTAEQCALLAWLEQVSEEELSTESLSVVEAMSVSCLIQIQSFVSVCWFVCLFVDFHLLCTCFFIFREYRL